MRVYLSMDAKGFRAGDKAVLDDVERSLSDIYRRFGEDTEIVNPTFVGFGLNRITMEEYIKVAFVLMDISDVIYFCRTKSEIAEMEKIYAGNTGMRVMEASDDKGESNKTQRSTGFC